MAQSLTTKKGKLRKSAKKKMIKSASKAISRPKTKTERNIIKIGNAIAKKVKLGKKSKAPGSSKTQKMSRQQISNRDIDEDKLRELVSDYAKAANRRLRSLEKGNVQEASAAYRQIRTFSRDSREFMGTTKNGEFKFRTDVSKMDKETLQREALELDTFLFRSKTSTVKGVKALYREIKKKVESQNAEGTKEQWVMDYFKNMSMEDFNQFWENQSMSEIVDAYGSDEVIRLIQEGEDKGLDLEKMHELLLNIYNKHQKEISIKKLEDSIRKDIQIEYAKRQTGANIAVDTQNILDELESTEPEIGVDEDGFMKLY